MYQAHILTPFAGDGIENDPYHPAVADDHTLTAWTDITGTPSAAILPAPNLYVVETMLEADVLLAIEADDRYFILSAEEIVEAVSEPVAEPSPAEVSAPAQYDATPYVDVDSDGRYDWNPADEVNDAKEI